MAKVTRVITCSKCRSGYFKKGQEYIVEDLCLPLCHELWSNIYPFIFVLQNEVKLDCGNVRAQMFGAICSDESRAGVCGEVIEE